MQNIARTRYRSQSHPPVVEGLPYLTGLDLCRVDNAISDLPSDVTGSSEDDGMPGRVA